MTTKNHISQDSAFAKGVERRIADGHTLLKSGVSREELRRRHIASGMTPAQADVLGDAAVAYGKYQRKAIVKDVAQVLAAPLVLLAIGLGVWGIYSWQKAPNPYTPTVQATSAVCGSSSASGAVIIDDEVILVQGESLRVDGWTLASTLENYREMVFDGDEFLPTKVLCSTVTPTEESISCDGYFSEEVLDVVDVAESMDHAVQLLEQKMDGTNMFQVLGWIDELRGTGMVVEISGARLESTLYRIADGAPLASASAESMACPDTYYPRNSLSSHAVTSEFENHHYAEVRDEVF